MLGSADCGTRRRAGCLAIPALIAAGGLEAAGQASAVSATVGWGNVAVGRVVSFVVAYATIAWLLRLVAHDPIMVFVVCRVGLGVLLLALLDTGVLSAT